MNVRVRVAHWVTCAGASSAKRRIRSLPESSYVRSSQIFAGPGVRLPDEEVARRLKTVRKYTKVNRARTTYSLNAADAEPSCLQVLQYNRLYSEAAEVFPNKEVLSQVRLNGHGN